MPELLEADVVMPAGVLAFRRCARCLDDLEGDPAAVLVRGGVE